MRKALNRRSSLLIESLENRAYLSVNLTDTVSFASASRQIKAGHFAALEVKITDEGTTAAIGTLAITLGLSLDSDGSSPTDLQRATGGINLQPGEERAFRIPIFIPATTTPGAYFALAEVDPSNTFKESNLTNKTGVTEGVLTVVGRYPSVLGTYTGSYKITKGPGKKDVGNLSWDLTTEDSATGTFTGTATTTLPGGTITTTHFSGSVKSNGAFTTASDTASSVGITHSKGKFAGKKVTGTYTNDVGGGTFKLTLQT